MSYPHNNAYLEIPIKITFRSAQQGSCYCKMRAPERIINIFHIDEPEMGISKKPKSIWVVSATIYLFFNYWFCWGFFGFLGPQTLPLNYSWFLASNYIYLYLSMSLSVLFFSGHCCMGAFSIETCEQLFSLCCWNPCEQDIGQYFKQ